MGSGAQHRAWQGDGDRKRALVSLVHRWLPVSSCFLTDCLTLLNPCYKITQAFPAAFKLETEFRAGRGS